MHRFELCLPSSLDECLAALRGDGAARVVAGGTDLLPQLKNGLLRPARLVDLSGVPELRALERGPDGSLRLGSALTARALERAPEPTIAERALVDAAALIGSLQIRNLATVGGNLCNAAPSADLAPPLLALDATAVIAGPGGQRRVLLSEFFLGPRQTCLAPDEVLVGLVIPPRPAASGSAYLRHTPRRELDIAVAGAAAALTLVDGRCRGVRLALAAVAPTPLRVPEAEAALEGEAPVPPLLERAAELAAAAARPISDQRGSAEYRRHLVRVLTRRALEQALARAAGAVTTEGV